MKAHTNSSSNTNILCCIAQPRSQGHKCSYSGTSGAELGAENEYLQVPLLWLASETLKQKEESLSHPATFWEQTIYKFSH